MSGVQMLLMRQNRPRKLVEKHGDTRKDGFKEREYVCWTQMIQRCVNPDSAGYNRYGGRGITVCSRWRNSYIAFRNDMGRKPSRAHSIERINNNGNYEPKNCRWSLCAEQYRNRSSNNNLTAFGKRRCITDWAADIGAYPSAISSRLEHGWSVEDAVSVLPEKHEQTAITCGDETLTIAEWSRRSGVSVSTIAHRLKTGVNAEVAIFQKESLKTGRKATKFLVVDDVSKSIEEWAEIRKIGRTTIEQRISLGWTVKDAVMSPLGTRKFAPVSKLEHGTINGYSYHKCRCVLCKKAKSNYRNKQ